jgi:NAD(P)-dependent dehydrogenase (short-subunit alcohol dehydrogenase family)
MIAGEGNTAEAIVADVTDDAACAAAVARTVSSWGALTVLVNNVGVAGPREAAPDVDLDAWDAAMRVNVRSFVSMAKHSVPHMARAGGGAIVNVASIAGYLGAPQLLYSTSKGAVLNMTRSMAVAHGREGVRVNAVAPGHVYTPMVSGMTPEERERRRRAAPLGVEGTAWDVGHAVVFLAGPRARWITGVTLPVDGGLTCAMI